jgi:hypothetical protein
MKSSEIETRVTEQAVTKTELLNASAERSANLAFFLLVVLVGLFLMLTPVKAQGFLPGDIDAARGTIDDVLNGAGTVEDTIGSLAGVIDNFSWDGLLDFACNAATTVDGAEQTTTSGDVAEVACGVAGFLEEVTALTENGAVTIDDVAQTLFSNSTLFDLTMGGLLTGEELQGYQQQIEAALDSDTPQEAVEAARDLFTDVAQTQYENYDKAPEGSVEGVADGAIDLSPNLQAVRALGIQEQANNSTAQFQTMVDTRASSEIAQAQAESTFAEDLNEGVQEKLAPALREEAYSAVSTRATVQEVVNSITRYMEQDADQFAYLSEQLTLQSQQEVYSTHVLQTLATTMLEERSQELKSHQSAINLAIYRNTETINQSVDQVANVAGSFTEFKGEHEPLDLSLFDY